MSVPWLRAEATWFPPSSQALDDPNGLLALGGDLSPSRLIAAYYRGIFPWFNEGQPILWWSPNPRTVFFPSRIHCSRSLAKHLRASGEFVTIDTHFDAVIQACAEPRAYAAGTWLSDEMQAAYRQLHRLGFAHSIEVWQGSELVGGLYGICLGRIFFGESMFSRRTNGSKTALLALRMIAQELDIALIDCQVGNSHVFSMGAENLTRVQFEHYLQLWATPALTQNLQTLWAPLRLRHIPSDHLIQP